MKNLIYLLMMALGATMFTACSDDDDKDVDEGITDVTILPKKIKKVLYYEYDEDDRLEHSSEQEFDYDADGRIISCKQGDEIAKYTYSENKITIKMDKYDEEYNFIVENGRIASSQYIDRDGIENRTFKYDGNYLNKVNATYKEDGEEGSWTETFSFSNGNLSKYEYNDDGDWENAVFTYGNRLNNLNIDLFYFLDYLDSDIAIAFQFNMTGKRSKYLPSSVKFSYPEWDEDEEKIIRTETDTVNFTYEMDGEYITKITAKRADGDAEIYEIEYE